MKDCLFCKFVRGEIPPKKAYEDESVLAFHDIRPQAPTHVLVIPKEHVSSLDALEAKHAEVAGRLFLAAAKVAKDLKLGTGYRCVVNTGPDAGQTVFHIHMHLLGGRGFAWPPG